MQASIIFLLLHLWMSLLFIQMDVGLSLSNLSNMGAGFSHHCFNPNHHSRRPSTDDDFVLSAPLGHSFCYLPPTAVGSTVGIFGASVSGNASTSRTVICHDAADGRRVNGFESTPSFTVLPLQPAAESNRDRAFFLSSPIERGGLSGMRALGADSRVPFSAPLGGIKKCVSRIWKYVSPADEGKRRSESDVQWALGKAGEDGVHVVLSEEHGWLFVGIYDGFNGPDVPEFLMENLYKAVYKELEGLFWDYCQEKCEEQSNSGNVDKVLSISKTGLGDNRRSLLLSKLKHWFVKHKDSAIKSWNFGLEGKDQRELVSSRIVESSCKSGRRRKVGPVDHQLVLRAMSRALEVTELGYLDMTDKVMEQYPELALMGSCLLAVLLRDEDVYVMNLGDSRAIVAQYEPKEVGMSMDSTGLGNVGASVEGIVEVQARSQDARLTALQLSCDHNTSIDEEIKRIRNEHPDDTQCIVNDRVKGRLKVTRAFGAGFLKQAKWNDSLLKMFRNEFIGNAPYISCSPSLTHHKLCPRDQFLVFSSDGLYQYLSNQDMVSRVECFMEKFPHGDPAKHLIEELLLCAAKTAGLDLHELLDIPQGDRRKYHDDVTVMAISLEGRIWKSSGEYH